MLFILSIRHVLTLTYRRGDANGILGLHRVTCHYDQYLSPTHVEHCTPILHGLPLATFRQSLVNGELKIYWIVNAQGSWQYVQVGVSAIQRR